MINLKLCTSRLLTISVIRSAVPSNYFKNPPGIIFQCAHLRYTKKVEAFVRIRISEATVKAEKLRFCPEADCERAPYKKAVTECPIQFH